MLAMDSPEGECWIGLYTGKVALYQSIAMGVLPVLLLSAVTAGAPKPLPDLAVGLSSAVYVHAYEYEVTSALDLTLTLPFARAYAFSQGVRFGFSPAVTEVFGRLLLMPGFGLWQPAIGVECGVTSRSNLGEGDVTRREIRRPIESEVKPYYGAFHASPLRFDLGAWRVAFLELRIGTHLFPAGRLVRLEAEFISLGHHL